MDMIGGKNVAMKNATPKHENNVVSPSVKYTFLRCFFTSEALIEI